MSGVVDFTAARKARAEAASPHSTGEAVCLNCKHKWQAVVPVGLTVFECPSCSCHYGVLVYPAHRDALTKLCAVCGSWAFSLITDKAGDNLRGLECLRCATMMEDVRVEDVE